MYAPRVRALVLMAIWLVAAGASAQVLPGGQEELVRRLLTVEGCTLERAQVWPEEVRGALVCDGVAFAVRLVHPSQSEGEATRGVAVLVDPAHEDVDSAVRANLEGDEEAVRWIEPREEPEPTAPDPPRARDPEEPEPEPRDWTHGVTGGLLLLGWVAVARVR